MKISTLLHQTRFLVLKDLRREIRTREVLTTTITFAILLVVLFAFAFYREGETVHTVFPGILWVSVIFTGTLTISRTFHHEAQGDCLRALALIPGSATSLYLGKFLINLLFVILFEVILFSFLVIAFAVELGPHGWLHVLNLFLGTLGFVALGTLVTAMLVRSDLRDVLLPVVLYPLLIPLLIAGVLVTRALLAGEGFQDVRPYLQAMLAMDLVYGLLGIWLFRWVLQAVE